MLAEQRVLFQNDKHHQVNANLHFHGAVAEPVPEETTLEDSSGVCLHSRAGAPELLAPASVRDHQGEAAAET
jgi:hypothetical protein